MKKLFLILSLACLSPSLTTLAKNMKLKNPLLEAADTAGFFNGPILDILRTREAMIDLVTGKKMWRGAIVNLQVDNTHLELAAYTRRPEALFGATFVVVTLDHPKLMDFVTSEQIESVKAHITKKEHKSLYDRQINASTDMVFTGSYAINPVNQEKLPVYISDYAIETFDIRRTHTRIAIPAHNSKDFEFAKKHKLPIKIVVTAPDNLIGVDNNSGLVIAAPNLDNTGKLKEVYIGEYRECTLQNSGFLNNMEIHHAAKKVINFLEEHGTGIAHEEPLQYKYDNQYHSIKNLTKVESFIYEKKDLFPAETLAEKIEELKVLLNYAQADFLEIVEPFFVNARNTKELMIDLIEESCRRRDNPHCYLLRWCHLNNNEDERTVFHRDINSVRELTIFCKDLVNFLGDLAHSCPRALEDLRKRSS